MTSTNILTLEPGSQQAIPDPAREITKSKAVNGTVIAVGLLMIGGGVFGGLGLLQMYKLIHLPTSWLTTAITYVGNTHNHWSLWTLAVGGVVGIAMVSVSSHKIHRIRNPQHEVILTENDPLGGSWNFVENHDDVKNPDIDQSGETSSDDST